MAERKLSRRSLFKRAFGQLGSPPAEVRGEPSPTEGRYRIVDRRPLREGVGLFVSVRPGLWRDELLAVCEALRGDCRDHANVVAEVFDDPAAARTVLAGSRVVGEAAFAAALAHQVAGYQKIARSGKHVVFIYGIERETIDLSPA